MDDLGWWAYECDIDAKLDPIMLHRVRPEETWPHEPDVVMGKAVRVKLGVATDDLRDAGK